MPHSSVACRRVCAFLKASGSQYFLSSQVPARNLSPEGSSHADRVLSKRRMEAAEERLLPPKSMPANGKVVKIKSENANKDSPQERGKHTAGCPNKAGYKFAHPRPLQQEANVAGKGHFEEHGRWRGSRGCGQCQLWHQEVEDSLTSFNVVPFCAETKTLVLLGHTSTNINSRILAIDLSLRLRSQ